jgi:C4-dicarboxylate-binding protein DctP
MSANQKTFIVKTFMGRNDKMRSLNLISLILMLYSTAILAVPNQDQLKKDLGLENVIIFSHVVAKDTPKGKGAEWLKQQVEAKTNELGYPKVQVYPDSVLFNDTKVMTALEKNTVQLAAPSISKLVNPKERKNPQGETEIVKCNPKLQIFDFPFLFNSISDVRTFYEQAKEKIFFQKGGMLYLNQNNDSLKECEKGENYLVLGLWHGGMKQVSSNQEIITSNKKPFFEGSKFRVQSSPIIELTFAALGAIPNTEDDFSKVYKKLERKEVDGQDNTWSNIFTAKFHKVQKHFVETNHGYLGYLLIANKNFVEEHLQKQSSRDTWLAIIDKVTSQVEKEADDSNNNAKAAILSYFGEGEKTEGTAKEVSAITGEKRENEKIPTISEYERENWCKTIYNDHVKEWEQLVKEIGKEIVQMAIQNKDKTVCPYDFLRGIN